MGDLLCDCSLLFYVPVESVDDSRNSRNRRVSRRGQDEEVDARLSREGGNKIKVPMGASRSVDSFTDNRVRMERGRETGVELAERIITRHGDVLILAHIVHSDLVYTARPVNFNRVDIRPSFVSGIQDATRLMTCNLRGSVLITPLLLCRARADIYFRAS